MSLDTYANLKAEIRDWCHRNDQPDDKIDNYIDLAEQTMFANDVETLMIREEESRERATTSTTSRYLALPDGYLSMRSLKIIPTSGDPWDVKFRAPEHLKVYDESSTGRPTRFTVTSQIEFNRVSDEAYTVEMNLLKTITALSDANTTNAVLTNYPSIYLDGALWALFKWTQQPELAVPFFNDFITGIRGANVKVRQGKYGPAPIMRVEGVTP